MMNPPLKLHGSIIDNLKAAINSAERLRGHPVHQDTLQFWRDLLAHARAQKRHASPADVETLEQRIGELQSQLITREQSPGVV